jgi:16S rRNA processing protein RimM
MKLIEIAQISRLHGFKGSVVAHTDSGKESALGYLSLIYLGSTPENSTPYQIITSSWMPKGWKLELATVNTEVLAKALVGQRVFALRNELLELNQNEYYVSDLIGLRAFELETQKEIGVFISLSESPGPTELKSSSWVFSSSTGEISVPAIKKFIHSVDLAEKKIWLKNLKGLQ